MKLGLGVALFAIPLSFSIVHADGPPSGWAVCNLNTGTYDQTACIVKAERFKGVDAPYTTATTQDEAVELYEWAGADPHSLSPCTARGVGGPLLPEEILAQCEEPTPTATWTQTPTPTVTVTPAGPVATETVQPTVLTPSVGEPALVMELYLPLIGGE